MILFVLGGSGGGGVNYVPYDAYKDKTEFQTKATEIKDDVTLRAYESALKADYMSQMNLDMLNEGLGLISNVMGNDIEETRRAKEYGGKLNSATIQNMIDTKATTKNVSDSLLSYISNSQSMWGGGSS